MVIYNNNNNKNNNINKTVVHLSCTVVTVFLLYVAVKDNVFDNKESDSSRYSIGSLKLVM